MKIRQMLMNAEGTEGGGQAQAADTTQQATQQTQQSPVWGVPAGTQPQAAQNPLLTQTPQEYLDFAGRKVPVVDPVLHDVYKDYTNLNSTYTKTNQELAEMRGRAQALEQMVQQYQQAGAQQQQPQAPQGPSAEDMEAAKEAFMNRFYDDPLSAIEELVTSKVNPVMEPITKEREWNQQVSAMEGKHADFRTMAPQMEAILQQNPQASQLGLESVYWMAKGQMSQSQPPAPSPEQMLADPQFVQNYILQNPNIQQQVMSAYLQNKQATNQQIPVVIGNQAGGTPPAMPENRPTSIREGSKAFGRYLGL